MPSVKLELYKLHADEYITPKTPEPVKTMRANAFSITSPVFSLYSVVQNQRYGLHGRCTFF